MRYTLELEIADEYADILYENRWMVLSSLEHNLKGFLVRCVTADKYYDIQQKIRLDSLTEKC